MRLHLERKWKAGGATGEGGREIGFGKLAWEVLAACWVRLSVGHSQSTSEPPAGQEEGDELLE